MRCEYAAGKWHNRQVSTLMMSSKEKLFDNYESSYEAHFVRYSKATQSWTRISLEYILIYDARGKRQPKIN